MTNNYFNNQSHIDLLWDMGYLGRRVRVGIVDTGLYTTKGIKKRIACGHNFSLDISPRDDISSNCYHGLAVASLILSVAPSVKLVIAKVLNDKGEGDPRKTAEGIRYCIAQNCDIINCSVAGPADKELENAINEARAKGILVVAATGNDGKEKLMYPASYFNCIAVGSIDKDCNIADFSNYNVFVNLVAPGVDIPLKIDNERIIDSGTSFSAPLVAGVLALLKEKLRNDLKRKPTYDEIYNLLISNCEFIENVDIKKQGNGYINFKNV